MKEDRRNLTDAIGMMATDIETIKKQLEEIKTASNVKKESDPILAKLEPLAELADEDTVKVITKLFGNDKKVDEYRATIIKMFMAELNHYFVDTTEDHKAKGGRTMDELLLSIESKLAELMKERNAQHGDIPVQVVERETTFDRFCLRIKGRCNSIGSWWSKPRTCWWSSPHAWAVYIPSTLIFLFLGICWWKVNEYRSDHERLINIEAKHNMNQHIMEELSPKLSNTIGQYDKLSDKIGADSVMRVFKKQVKQIKK